MVPNFKYSNSPGPSFVTPRSPEPSFMTNFGHKRRFRGPGGHKRRSRGFNIFKILKIWNHINFKYFFPKVLRKGSC